MLGLEKYKLVLKIRSGKFKIIGGIRFMKYNRILLVDDSATSRMIIKRCLKIAGYRESEYFEVEDGLEALTFFEEDNTADLIVTDLNMPRMDGNNLIKKLKVNKKTKKIPILIISSMGDDIFEDELKILGVKGVIQKPISPAKIIDILGV
jgi:CheY-like chemotaxis protein